MQPCFRCHRQASLLSGRPLDWSESQPAAGTPPPDVAAGLRGVTMAAGPRVLMLGLAEALVRLASPAQAPHRPPQPRGAVDDGDGDDDDDDDDDDD